MMRDLLKVLPDDRPVTSICIIEDPNKPPQGYLPVTRTYDQDADADLWKEGIFGKKITRYLCLSKTEGQQNYVVDSIAIISDKEPPPSGYTALVHTLDTHQKATKKRQICFRKSQRDIAREAVNDIILLSKSKKAPAGFTLAGEMNGFLVCYKTCQLSSSRPQSPQTAQNHSSQINASMHSSPYSNSYTMNRLHSRSSAIPSSVASSAPSSLPYPVTPVLYPVDQLQNASASMNSRSYTPGHDYRMTWHPGFRPAAQLPNMPISALHRSQRSNVASSGFSFGLDGVPFEKNVKIQELHNLKSFVIPKLEKKTAFQIDAEYEYNFTLEEQALQRLPSQ